MLYFHTNQLETNNHYYYSPFQGKTATSSEVTITDYFLFYYYSLESFFKSNQIMPDLRCAG